MSPNPKRWLAVFCSVLLSGCWQVKFEDVSNSPEHAQIMGKSFNSVVELNFSGVNAPPGYEKHIDFYLLEPVSPTWSGPELISREVIPAGASITVRKTLLCENCYLDSEPRIKFEVTLEGFAQKIEKPIFIKKQHLSEAYFNVESPET